MTNGAFNVPQATIETGLIAAALVSNDSWIELRHQIDGEDFTTSKPIYQFIEQYQIQYGNLPTTQLIASRFDWHPPLGDFQYWLTEMKRYALARKITETMQEAFRSVGNPDEALNLLLEKLSIIRSQSTNHIQAYDSSAQERYQKYLARNQYMWNTDNMLGLPTGMRIIDETRIGWIPGNMTGCFSRPGVGKTWWLMWQGVLAWMAGKKVLVFSGEMPANFLSLRIDVLVAQMLGYPIDYNKLIGGDPSIKENYKFITEVLEQSQRWWTYDSVNERPVGLADISSLSRQHQPDVILVDGISLLRASSSQVWEQIKELSYGLKNIATIHEVPIIVTHQAVNSAKGRRTEIEIPGRGDDFIMPSLNDIAYGDAFAQACSDVISMCGDKQYKHINWYSFRKTRERAWQQAMPQRMAFAWDPGNGRIIDLSERGYNQEAIGTEARRVLGLTELT